MRLNYIMGEVVPNRTLCAVFEAMRKLDSTKNYSSLLSLIEEAQMLGDRMEAALWDQKDFEHARKEHKKLKAEIKEMKEAKNEDAD